MVMRAVAEEGPWPRSHHAPIFIYGMDENSLDRLRDALKRVLADVPEVAAAYAYGSRVSGRPLSSSDLDVAVLLREGEASDDPLLAERIAARLTLELGSSVEADVHLARTLPLPIQGRVITTGVLLHEADPSARVEFETATRRLYFDFLPFIERDAREGLLAGA